MGNCRETLVYRRLTGQNAHSNILHQEISNIRDIKSRIDSSKLILFLSSALHSYVNNSANCDYAVDSGRQPDTNISHKPSGNDSTIDFDLVKAAGIEDVNAFECNLS